MIKIIPYVKVDGVPTFKDSEIRDFWYRMIKEKTVEIVFTDGSIQSAREFIKAMKSPDNFLIVVYWDGVIMGIMWANRFQHNYAQNHFCAFKDFWGTACIPLCGKAGSLYLLENLNLGVLMGLVPKNNHPAVNAVITAGGNYVGELPNAHKNKHTGEVESLIILSYTKEGNEDESNN
jgi:hypothetical protein